MISHHFGTSLVGVKNVARCNKARRWIILVEDNVSNPICLTFFDLVAITHFTKWIINTFLDNFFRLQST